MGAAADIAAELVGPALAGDPRAVRRLIDALAPVVQARVARTLLRCGGGTRRDVRQDVKDLVQQVFVALFENDARVLRQWDPERGRSLTSFVSLVAEREVISVLRSTTRSPWTEEPMAAPDALDDEDAGPERVAASREALAALLADVRARLSERGVHLFHLLFVDGWEVEDVALANGMTRDAVYAWQARFRRLLREHAGALQRTPAELPRAKESGHA